ncbi:unnamed protein product [Caenorhabditis auriculariae]|uniref:Tudor domain-containing protein n=1 Tax=Caenorhabditis auriculariae TaxID=2777116 RepID=A0A8S1HP24_9PELO|nr:unnamed protein product [Caenorhabditis auriculariae]
MLCIGSKPLENELFGSTWKTPIVEFAEKTDPKMILNGKDPSTGKIKINRIYLTRSAVVEILHAESPNEIWVRLSNHITSELCLREPYKLRQMANFEVGDYAIAPVSDRVFGRCIIEELRTEDRRKIVRIFFIDEGTRRWVYPEVLHELEERLAFHPWQAILVSMANVAPTTADLYASREWKTRDCEILREILNGFPYLRIDVLFSSALRNDYSRPVIADIYGVKNDGNEISCVSIANLFIEYNLEGVDVLDSLTDAADHVDYPAQETNEKSAVDPSHPTVPDDWKNTEEEMADVESSVIFKMSLREDGDDFDLQQCQVPIFEDNDIKKFVHDGKVLVALENFENAEPFELYARPIGPKKNEEKTIVSAETEYFVPCQWLLEAEEQYRSAAEKLDAFYSNAKNRKTLPKEEIEEMHRNGWNVYAVCAVHEDRAVVTGEWQRVEVLQCDMFAHVRYLDSGGREKVLLTSLYKIHKQHCTYPPLCLQLCLSGIRERREIGREGWSDEAVEKFRSVILSDECPMEISGDFEMLGSDRTPLELQQSPPYMAPHVWFISKLRILSHNGTVHDNMLKFIPNVISQPKWPYQR